MTRAMTVLLLLLFAGLVLKVLYWAMTDWWPLLLAIAVILAIYQWIFRRRW